MTYLTCNDVKPYVNGFCDSATHICDRFSGNFKKTTSDASIGLFIASAGLATYGVIQTARLISRLKKDDDEEVLPLNEFRSETPSIKTQIVSQIGRVFRRALTSHRGITGALVIGFSLSATCYYFGKAISESSAMPHDFCVQLTRDCISLPGTADRICEDGNLIVDATIQSLVNAVGNELKIQIVKQIPGTPGGGSGSIPIPGGIG